MGGTIEYSATSSAGAVLLTQDVIISEDSKKEKLYKSYIKKNFKSWLRYAEDQGYDIALGDIILVTGHDTTHKYAMAAFANNDTAIRIAFGASLSGTASASVSSWGTWQGSPIVHHNCGPIREQILHDSNNATRASQSTSVDAVSGISALSESQREDHAEHAQFDQCIFVRGYRMRERSSLFPPIVKAAALGARQPDTPQDPGPHSPVPAQTLSHFEQSWDDTARDSNNVMPTDSETTRVRSFLLLRTCHRVHSYMTAICGPTGTSLPVSIHGL